MLLASLLVPIAVLAIVLLVQRLHLPAFLAIMATVVLYGIAADMTFQSVGKAFGLGFSAALSSRPPTRPLKPVHHPIPRMLPQHEPDPHELQAG